MDVVIVILNTLKSNLKCVLFAIFVTLFNEPFSTEVKARLSIGVTRDPIGKEYLLYRDTLR